MTTAAVIVTYNPNPEDLKILFANTSEVVSAIVVVDNGSRNISEIEVLGNSFGNFRLIKLGENKGIGFAQNRGIEWAIANAKVEGVVLFDHDSHPEKNMIELLAGEYERMKAEGIKVGAVGPVFFDPRTNNQYPISVFSGFSLKKKYATDTDTTPIEASFLIASGSLLPWVTLKEVGLMNEDFFIDYIDIEWGFRAQSKGYKLFACPGARMFHQVGDERMKVLGREISIHSPLRRYYLARNSILMVRTGYINWRYKVRETYYSLTRIVVYLMMVNNKRNYLKHIVRGLVDGLRGKKGPAPFIQNKIH